MTKKEFASEIQIREKQFNRGLYIGLMVMGFWMLSAPLLDHFYSFKDYTSIAQAWAGMGAVLAVLFFVIFLIYAGKRGMPCPHCKKRVFGIPGQIVVATGHCGYCGEKVFE